MPVPSPSWMEENSHRNSKSLARARSQSTGISSELKVAREQSTNKLHLAWQSIFDRYTTGSHLADGKDDVVDLETGDIIEDGGFLRDSEDTIDIGSFGLPGSMGEFDTSDEERLDDEEDGYASEVTKRNTESGSFRNTGSETPGMDLGMDLSEVSSSEDELGNWNSSARNIPPVSERYKRQRRAKEDLAEDLQSFLEIEASTQLGERMPRSGASTPTARRIKTESVKPRSYSSVPASFRHSTVLATSASDTSELAVKLEGISSPYPPRRVSQVRRGSSCTPSKVKPLEGTKSGTISSSIRMAGGNNILSQAILCEDDSSDDDLILVSPSHHPAERYLPFAPTKREYSTIPNLFPSPPPSKNGTSKNTANAAFSSSLPSTPSRIMPVVEIPYKRFTATASPQPVHVPDMPPKRQFLSTYTKPKRSSPLKTSISAPALTTSFPLTPPPSRTSKDGSEETGDTFKVSSDRYTGPCKPHTVLKKTSATYRMGNSPCASPELECVTPSSRLSRLSLGPQAPTNPEYYFGRRQPHASTSSLPAGGHAPRPRRNTVDSSRSSAPTPKVHKKGSEPWRICNALPTPPPDSFTSHTSIEMGSSPEKGPEDVFQVPHYKLSATRAQCSPQKRRRSPDMHQTPFRSVLTRSEDDDDLILLAASQPVESITRTQNIIISPYSQTRFPARMRSCSIVSTSPVKRRLGSVARHSPQKAPPPDDDGYESGDPLGI